MIIFYSGNAGVPKIEPETYLRGKGCIMLTFHWIARETSQRRRFKDVRRARRKAPKKGKHDSR